MMDPSTPHTPFQVKETPLHRAADGGHTEVVMALIEWGGNVHAKSSIHKTPLHSAGHGL